MARPGRPGRNREVRSFRQLRRFHRVINTDRVFGTHRRTPAPSNDTKQRITAYGQHKSAGKARRCTVTQGKPKVMDDQIEPCCSPRLRCQSAVIEALCENKSTAHNVVAAEAARHADKPKF